MNKKKIIKNKKQLIITTFLLSSVMIIIAFTSYYRPNRLTFNDDKTTAYINRADPNITFELIPDEGVMDTFFTVLDEEGKEVEATMTYKNGIITVLPPEGNYASQKNYSIILLCSSFKESKLKSTKKIIFKTR